MPIVRIEAFPGRTPQQKQRTAEAVTAAVAQHMGCAPAHVTVLFFEVPRSDWAIGGAFTPDPDAAAEGPPAAA